MNQRKTARKSTKRQELCTAAKELAEAAHQHASTGELFQYVRMETDLEQLICCGDATAGGVGISSFKAQQDTG